MDRPLAEVVRGRAIGIGVGALIACGWAAWSVSSASLPIRLVVGVFAVLVTLVLLEGARRLVLLARALPVPAPGEQRANRRAWSRFWVNLVAEIVLLNAAVALLQGPGQRRYWIPAISLVVGLHFIPMAIFFRIRSYFACAAAMIAVAALVATGIAIDAATPTALVAFEALLNAAILWSTAGWGLQTLTARLRQ